MHIQVSSFDGSYTPSPTVLANGTAVYTLQDSFVGPLLLQSLALLHFAVSAILIVAYWYLKVCLIIISHIYLL